MLPTTTEPLSVAVIGLGNLGVHHALGALRADEIGDLWIYDTQSAREAEFAATLANEIPHKSDRLRFLRRERPPVRGFDLAILAMTADSRAQSLLWLQSLASSRRIVLEKPLSTTLEGLNLIKGASSQDTLVNFPRRYSQLHQHVTQSLRDESVTRIEVALPSETLLSNTSHFIDLAQEIFREAPLGGRLEPGKSEVIRSKRDGFQEIKGALTIDFSNGRNMVVCTPQKTKAQHCTISISTATGVWRLDETENSVRLPGSATKSIMAGIPLQSSLTTTFVQELAACRTSLLPTASESLPGAEVLVRAILEQQTTGLPGLKFS